MAGLRQNMTKHIVGDMKKMKTALNWNNLKLDTPKKLMFNHLP